MNELTLTLVFRRALAIRRKGRIMGLFGFLGDKNRDDEETAEANEFVLDTLSDADTTRRVWFKTGRHLRDQVTVEEAIEMGEETEHRRWGWRWS